MAVVTIKDIAKECGISFSAVSKALKGSSEIGASTIKLVNETAKRMGYQPNAAARKLRTNRSYDIGVIFEDLTGSGLQHQFFAYIFEALNVAANDHGYNITFLNSRYDEKDEKTSYLAQTLYRGFDGVVIVSSNDFENKNIQELLNSKVPVTALDYISPDRCSSVLSDNRNGMKQLVSYLIENGHKKIAYIYGDNSFVTKDRILSYKEILEQNGISISEEYLIQGIYHEPKSSAEATKKLLALKERPTCILYPDDFACLGGVRSLHEAGLVPGKDISICGYDGIYLSEVMSPSLVTYQQNAEELGSKLIELLINQIESGEKPEYKTVQVSGQLKHGNSVVKI